MAQVNCASEVFDGTSACNACRMRYCYGILVSLFICLFKASIVSIQIDISSDFSDYLGYHSSFLETHCRKQNSKGTPLLGALNTLGWENFCKYRPLSWKQYEVDP